MTTKPFTLSVKMVLRDPAGRCLLIKRSAASKNHAGLWELPGGKVDPGETFDESVIREVSEETGLTVQLDGPVGSGSSDAKVKTIVYLFLEGHCADVNVRLSEEHDEFRWVTLPELISMADKVSPQFLPFLHDYCRARGYSVAAG
jgi:8-oxo-dGTP diphosphatase